MNIGTRWKIEVDSFNITLYEKHRSKGKLYWAPVAYFSSLQNALKYLTDQEVSETKLKDVKVVVAKQDELYKLIKSIKERKDDEKGE